MNALVYDPISIILILVLLGLMPFFLMMISSFVKIVIVLGLIRNALGVQQSPPNTVINGLSIILTLYIMAPVFTETFTIVTENPISGLNISSIPAHFEKIKKPIQNFLLKHSVSQYRFFFWKTAKKLWPKELSEKLTPEDLIIIVPAFVVSEITSAFQIGFLIYLPFVTVDLIISNILLAMGMMMVSPMTISLPFKLMLFVLVNGWSRLIEGLILSYR